MEETPSPSSLFSLPESATVTRYRPRIDSSFVPLATTRCTLTARRCHILCPRSAVHSLQAWQYKVFDALMPGGQVSGVRLEFISSFVVLLTNQGEQLGEQGQNPELA